MCFCSAVSSLVCNVEKSVLLDLRFYSNFTISTPNIMISSPVLETTCVRARQIDTLKIFNDNVTCLQEDDEFMIEFVAGENRFIMLIILNPEFPKEKPLLKITPPIVHHWVNDNSEIVNAPGYLNFSVYSDLGRVVQVIIREFQKNPPELRQKNSPMCNGMPTTRNSPITNLESKSLCFSIEPYDEMSHVIARLHKMSTEELNRLNNDERSLSELTLSVPSVRNLSQTVDDFILSMEELASAKSECETKVEELKEEIEQQKTQLKDAECSYKTILEVYEKLMEKRSNQYVKKKLKEAIKNKDKDGEVIAERYLNGDLPFDIFLNIYMDYRSKVHMLQAKETELSRGSGMVKIGFSKNSNCS